MSQGSGFETPWTLPAIRRAPVESFELLRQCQEYSIHLGGPRIVATSVGIRVVREILSTESFWRMWERYYWTFKKMGVVVSKDNGNWTTRLWTRLAPDARPIIKLSDPIELEGGCLLYRLTLLGSSPGCAPAG